MSRTLKSRMSRRRAAVDILALVMDDEVGPGEKATRLMEYVGSMRYFVQSRDGFRGWNSEETINELF